MRARRMFSESEAARCPQASEATEYGDEEAHRKDEPPEARQRMRVDDRLHIDDRIAALECLPILLTFAGAGRASYLSACDFAWRSRGGASGPRFSRRCQRRETADACEVGCGIAKAARLCGDGRRCAADSAHRTPIENFSPQPPCAERGGGGKIRPLRSSAVVVQACWQRGPPRKPAGAEVGCLEAVAKKKVLTKRKRFFIISFLCC